MKTLDLNELLQNHPYPGRGIVLGRSADDKKAVIAFAKKIPAALRARKKQAKEAAR